MRYKPDHKARTRARVLAEAAALLRQRGATNLGVSEVMRRAGLTHGGFYSHFRSRDELIAEAINATFEEAFDRQVRIHDGVPADHALGRYVAFYLSGRHRDAAASGCPLSCLSADVERLGAEPRARFTAGARALTRWIAGRIRELGRPNPEASAIALLAELVGALSLARAELDPTRSDMILTSVRDDICRRLELPGAVQPRAVPHDNAPPA